jgi:hypothetical protein
MVNAEAAGFFKVNKCGLILALLAKNLLAPME